MKKIRIDLIVLVLLAVLYSSSANAQMSSKEVDQLVERAMDKFTVAGVAVAIVKDRKIIHEKGDD